MRHRLWRNARDAARSPGGRDHAEQEHHREDTDRLDDTHGNNKEGKALALALAERADTGRADQALHPGGQHFADAGRQADAEQQPGIGAGLLRRSPPRCPGPPAPGPVQPPFGPRTAVRNRPPLQPVWLTWPSSKRCRMLRPRSSLVLLNRLFKKRVVGIPSPLHPQVVGEFQHIQTHAMCE